MKCSSTPYSQQQQQQSHAQVKLQSYNCNRIGSLKRAGTTVQKMETELELEVRFFGALMGEWGKMLRINTVRSEQHGFPLCPL